jgi:hypothetical protein
MALTDMRRVLAEECHARICLGGKMTSFEGWMPGVAEEAFLTLHAARKHRESGGRALYLSALFGGAAAGLIEAIEGRTWDERLALPAREQHESLLGSRLEDRYRAAGELQEFLRSEGMRLLVECNGLSVEENRALFAATDLETVVVLVLRGLSAVAERRRP